MKIDAVITWVDGNDPRHREKRMKYATSQLVESQDKAAETRFSDMGEIFLCVASINRYAPWINKIYIVTDEQDPGLDDFLKMNFPQGHVPVEIVDHKVIFRGYEHVLPVFNSIAIETMTWRIPGLSDCFIEFNDDTILMKPVVPEDFFLQDGSVICYGGRSSMWWDRFTRLFKKKSAGTRKVTTKGIQINAAALAGERFTYIRPAHSQKALRRDVYESFFNEHQDVLLRNISCRFRDADQYSPESLQYGVLDSQGRCRFADASGELFFFQPRSKPGYFARKMKALKNFGGRFACFNSIDLASGAEREELVGWLIEKMDIRLY